MIREVEQKYEEHPDRLSSMVNYALLLATQRFDLIGAKKLYKDAMEISPENPRVIKGLRHIHARDARSAAGAHFPEGPGLLQERGVARSRVESASRSRRSPCTTGIASRSARTRWLC